MQIKTRRVRVFSIVLLAMLFNSAIACFTLSKAEACTARATLARCTKSPDAARMFLQHAIMERASSSQSSNQDLRPVQLEQLAFTGTLHGHLSRIATETPLHLSIVLLMTLGTPVKSPSIQPRGSASHNPIHSAQLHSGADTLRRARRGSQQEARSLIARGVSLYKRSSYDSAMACFTGARKLFTIAGDDYGVSQSELNRGNVYLMRVELDSARQCFIAARRLAERLKDNIAVAESYLGLATWFRETPDKDSARALLLHALSIFERHGERLREADARVTLGNLHSDQGQYAEARMEYERSSAVFESAQQYYHLAITLMNRANAQSQLGDRREAMRLMIGSDSLFSRIGNRHQRATLAGNMARTLMGLKQTDSARQYYMQQLELARETGDRRSVIAALMGLGSRAIDLHHYDSAAMHLYRALAVAEEINDSKSIGNVLGNIGRMNLLTKSYDKAEESYRRALTLNRRTGHVNGIFYCLAGLATLEENLGHLDAALVRRLECVRIAEKAGWQHQIAMAKRNLGNLLTKRGDGDSGKILIQEAIDMFMQITPQSIGCSYNDLGVALATSRRDSLAERVLLQAVEEAKRSRETRCLYNAQENLSSLYLRRGDTARALLHLIDADALRDSLDHDERIRTMEELQTRYETEKQRYTITLLEKEQEVSLLRIRQQQQELLRRSLAADQQRQRILLFERDDRIKELLLRQRGDSLHVQHLENRALTDNNNLLTEIAARRQIERNAMIGGLLLIAALSVLLVRRFQGKRRESQLLAESLDHKARAAQAEAIRTQAEALRREHEAQARYTQQLIQFQEDERRRLSRELHDGLGQSLTVLRNSALLGLRSSDAEVMRRQLDGMSGMIAETLDDVRAITRDLRPVQLEHLGLTGTLHGLLSRIAEETPLQMTHDICDLQGIIRPDDEINVFRLVQEAMSNILKHARADAASVRIAHDHSHVEIIMLDDGIGFDPNAPEVLSGLGMRGMHERVTMLSGALTVDTAPGRGTRIHIRLPIRH